MTKENGKVANNKAGILKCSAKQRDPRLPSVDDGMSSLALQYKNKIIILGITSKLDTDKIVVTREVFSLLDLRNYERPLVVPVGIKEEVRLLVNWLGRDAFGWLNGNASIITMPSGSLTVAIIPENNPIRNKSFMPRGDYEHDYLDRSKEVGPLEAFAPKSGYSFSHGDFHPKSTNKYRGLVLKYNDKFITPNGSNMGLNEISDKLFNLILEAIIHGAPIMIPGSLKKEMNGFIAILGEDTKKWIRRTGHTDITLVDLKGEVLIQSIDEFNNEKCSAREELVLPFMTIVRGTDSFEEVGDKRTIVPEYIFEFVKKHHDRLSEGDIHMIASFY